MVKKPRFLPAALLALWLVLCTAGFAATDREFKTTPVMRLETRTLVQLLEYFHYSKDAVKSADYPQLISDYMAELDPQRLFFTAEDEPSMPPCGMRMTGGGSNLGWPFAA